MDANTKKCCPNCSQLYKFMLAKTKSNIPVFLACGHSMCENCVRSLVKFREPIECKICLQSMELSTSDIDLLNENKISYYKLFPINYYIVGELAFQNMEDNNSNKEKTDNEYYIDVKAIINNTEVIQGECVECGEPTIKMCSQCSHMFCNNCFSKSHSSFAFFKSHVLQNIEPSPPEHNCNIHNKLVGYYCNDCEKAICLDCMMLGDKYCKNHNVSSIQEANCRFASDLSELTPKVDETLRRLTQTSVEIGTLLTKLDEEESTSKYISMLNNIEQLHFSKIDAIVQKQKDDITHKLCELKNQEKQSLLKAKDIIGESIKKAKNTLRNIKTLDSNKSNELNFASHYENAMQIINTPWFLHRDQTESTLNVVVKDDVYPLLMDYIKLEGTANPQYNLYSSQELVERKEEIPEAPKSIVYPPKLNKDARQKSKPQKKPKPVEVNGRPRQPYIKELPQYRSKSSSFSSNSDTSQKTNTTIYEQRRPVATPMTMSDFRHLKQLQEGTEEVVYVSHIVDPHNLYVQRACQQDKVQELLREFRTASSLPKPSVNHVAIGKMYLVLVEADNTWHRCRVVGIDKQNPEAPMVHVFCVDFGSSETVPIHKLRLLSPARRQAPPLAIHCRLANCEPVKHSWTVEDAALIQTIVDNKRVVIHIRHIRSTDNGTVSLECDITTFEDRVSLAHALAFQGCARVPNKQMLTKRMALCEKPKIFLTNDYKQKSVQEVYITNIVNPDKFFVRKSHHEKFYENLSRDLEREYSLSDTTGSVYLPEKDAPYVVYVEECDVGAAWARGVVHELPGRGRVRVLLCDTGLQLQTRSDLLRRIHTKFTTLSALATRCHLAGVTPHSKRWSPESVLLLQQFKGRPLEIHVEDITADSVGVLLYDKSDEDNVLCINELMVKYDYAYSYGLYVFGKQFELNDVVCDRKEILACLNPKKEKENKRMLANLEAKDQGTLRLETKVLNYQSPDLIYMSLVHQSKVFNELFEKIQKYYTKNKTNGKEEWNVEDRCCTICTQSQTWRRATILEIEGDSAEVFYSDFACVEKVPISALRELNSEFASVRDAAIRCHLCGVTPAGGDQWPSTTKEYLKELLDVYNRIFITVVGNFKGKSIPVELWVYHTIQGGALEADILEWRCLNQMIIEQGLALPDQSEQPEASDTNYTTIFVRDWLQIPSNNTNLEKNKSILVQIHENDLEAKDKGPLKLEVNVLNYQSPGLIYMSLVHQHRVLNELFDKMQKYYAQNKTRGKEDWEVEDRCCTISTQSQTWRRAAILEIEGDSAEVFYSDFACVEKVPISALRELNPEFASVADAAIRCHLCGVTPAGGDQWPSMTKEYLKELLDVYTRIFITKVGNYKGKSMPVELWAYHTNQDNVSEWHCINQIFIDEGLALPDRSKQPEDVKSDTNSETGSLRLNIDPEPENSTSDEDENESSIGRYVTFPPRTDREFLCTIKVMYEIDKFELNVVHDQEDTKMYMNMDAQLQIDSNEAALNGIYKNKACLALFPQDGQWYRAVILQYSETKKLVKVKYVDYGHTEVLSLDDLREIDEDYLVLPTATLTATLHGFKFDPHLDKKVVAEKATETFLNKHPFYVKVIKSDDIPSVELRNVEGKLVYESLIAEKVLLKCDEN